VECHSIDIAWALNQHWSEVREVIEEMKKEGMISPVKDS
jgi:Mn-dependent DtxR family transcriptional regulator